MSNMFMRYMLFLVAVLFLGTAVAAKAEYPHQPIKIVVPIGAGSTTDFIARILAEAIQGPLGQAVVVENRGGAGGSIGTAFVGRSTPDGYTLLLVSSSHAVNPAIYSTLPYDTVKDFSGVSMLVTLPNILVVSSSRGFQSMEELVKFGKQHPGKLNYGSGGIGSGSHMSGALFVGMANFNAVHVPYKGTPDIVNALLSNLIDFAFVPITTALPLISSGKLIPLAVGAPERTSLLPSVPTTVEAGVPGSARTEWIGLLAPAGTPAGIIKRLNLEVVRALNAPTMAERLASVGASPAPSTPEELDAFIKTAIKSATKTARQAGIPKN